MVVLREDWEALADIRLQLALCGDELSEAYGLHLEGVEEDERTEVDLRHLLGRACDNVDSNLLDDLLDLGPLAIELHDVVSILLLEAGQSVHDEVEVVALTVVEEDGHRVRQFDLQVAVGARRAAILAGQVVVISDLVAFEGAAAVLTDLGFVVT